MKNVGSLTSDTPVLPLLPYLRVMVMLFVMSVQVRASHTIPKAEIAFYIFVLVSRLN